MLYPYYVKKEDAHELVQGQRRAVGIMLLTTSIMFLIMQLVLRPSINELYETINRPLPSTYYLSYYSSTILIFITFCTSLYYFLTKPDYTHVDKVLSKYKAGEMIRTKEVINFKSSLLAIFLLMLMVTFLIISNTLPIYSTIDMYK